MPRRREVPESYEEFDRRVAGYRDRDVFEVSELTDGNKLTMRQLQELANEAGAITGQGTIEMRPATYGARYENRRAHLAMIARRLTD